MSWTMGLQSEGGITASCSRTRKSRSKDVSGHIPDSSYGFEGSQAASIDMGFHKSQHLPAFLISESLAWSFRVSPDKPKDQ